MPDDGARKKEVAIFGAGIAGLTAAHELIERGYRVEVFEMEQASPLDLMLNRDCDVGGKARTQWSRAERPEQRTPGEGMKPTQEIVPLLDIQVRFARGSVKLNAEARRQVKVAVERFQQAAATQAHGIMRRIEVRGYCRDKLPPLPQESAPMGRVDYERAVAVAKAFADELQNAPAPRAAFAKAPIECDVEPYLGSAKRQAARRGGGLSLTLSPVPMGLGLRDDWSADDERRDFVDFHVVEDIIPGEHGFRFFPSFYRNLSDTMRRTPIAYEGNLYIETSGSVVDNLVATKRQLIALDEPKQSFTFPRRPPGSMQESLDHLLNLLEHQGYCLDDIQRSMQKLFKYATSCPQRRAAEYEQISWWDFVGGDTFSAAFQRYFDDTGQTLLAMRTKECDARTYGNTTIQMMMDHVQEGAHVDGTLNGPTSVAWFDHWRRYLERQGVEFHRAKLVELIVHEGKFVWPVIERYRARTETLEAEPRPRTVLLRDYYVLAVGDVATKELCAELRGEDFDRLRDWDLGDKSVARPGGSHAHMSGIQYYFEGDIEFVDGHIDYADAEWGLTSISQPQFWRRQRGWWSGYRGVLSVDICTWFEKSRNLGLCAWDCTREEIADEIWKQIERTFPEKDRKWLPKPILYHLDRNIEFAMREGRVVPAFNRTPFLINLVGQYVRRPGKPEDYRVHYGSLVLAGDFMQTYTRMTTMEATNESARHAVNAILDADNFPGDRCRTWNPEKYEPVELRDFVELDKRMFEEGLPHFMDVLDWTPADVWRALADVRRSE